MYHVNLVFIPKTYLNTLNNLLLLNINLHQQKDVYQKAWKWHQHQRMINGRLGGKEKWSLNKGHKHKVKFYYVYNFIFILKKKIGSGCDGFLLVEFAYWSRTLNFMGLNYSF